MTMTLGSTREQFLEEVRWAQCAAYLGLDVERVQFTAYRDDKEFVRTFYALDDGTVIKRLTSKGFAPATAQETAEVLALRPS